MLICTTMYAQDAELTERSADVLAEQAIETPSTDQFVFRLNNGKEFEGVCDEDSSVVMFIANSKPKIPIFQIGSMTFDTNLLGKASVELRNGDRVMSQMESSSVELIAEWGTVILNTDSVSSMRLSM